MPTRFRRLPAGTLVAPSILSADMADLGAECRTVLRPASGRPADLLHLDVMDGHFVPNLTMGPDLCRSLRRAFPEVVLDVHLMVERPEDFVTPFADAGADLLTAHIEVCDEDARRPAALAARIHDAGCAAGLAINPDTPPARILDPDRDRRRPLDGFDLVLVMSVRPGFAGQRFIPRALDTARRIREATGPGTRIGIDGGVNPDNARSCRDAGADVLIAASAIFGQPSPTRGDAVRSLSGDSPDEERS